jgi:hypothetical protein
MEVAAVESRWQQFEGRGMGGTNDAKVTAAERDQASLSQALGQGYDACVDHSEIEIGVLALELQAAGKVLMSRELQAIRALQQVPEKCHPDVACQPLVAPVVELGQYESGHDEILRCARNKLGAARVILVDCVERRQERPGVHNQRH